MKQTKAYAGMSAVAPAPRCIPEGPRAPDKARTLVQVLEEQTSYIVQLEDTLTAIRNSLFADGLAIRGLAADNTPVSIESTAVQNCTRLACLCGEAATIAQRLA